MRLIAAIMGSECKVRGPGPVTLDVSTPTPPQHQTAVTRRPRHHALRSLQSCHATMSKTQGIIINDARRE